jgi:soluble lytic murein transglycosylase
MKIRKNGLSRNCWPFYGGLLILLAMQAGSTTQSLQQPVDALIAKDYKTAIRLMQGSAQNLKDSKDKDRALLLLGYCYYKVGEYDKAHATLLKDISQSALLKHYRLYYAAESSSLMQKNEQAEKMLNNIIQETPSKYLKARSLYSLSLCQINLEKYQAADSSIKQLEAMPAKKPAWDPHLLYIRANAQTGLKNKELADAILKQLWIKYPISDYAESAENLSYTLDDKISRIYNIRDAGRPAKALRELNNIIQDSQEKGTEDTPLIKLYSLRAQIYMHLRKYSLAIHQIDQLEKLMQTSDPKLLYQKAKALSRLDQDRDAVQIYKQIHKKHPDSEFAPKALYRAARLCQLELKHQDAMHIYKILIKEYPDKEESRDALFQLGWIYYLEKRFKRAAECLQEVPRVEEEPHFNARTLYWLARALDMTGKSKEAAELQEQILKSYPNTCYALFLTNYFNKKCASDFSRDTKSARNSNPETPETSKPSNPATSINTASEFSKECARDFSPDLTIPAELIQIGLLEDALEELKCIEKTGNLSEKEILQLAKLYLQANDYFSAHRLIHNKYGKEIEIQPQKYPEHAKLAFPLAYYDLVMQHSKTNNLDPFLILALVYAESRYKTDALSRAGATGLMQLIPHTARKMAKELGQDSLSSKSLNDPDTNLKLGCYYLAKLIKEFSQDKSKDQLMPLLQALASYNAGEDNVNEWKDQYQKVAPGPDEFLEMIPFIETRVYVRKVLAHYAIYNNIYNK